MPKVSFRMASASRESVFGVQTNTARKIHRSDHTEDRLTTAPSGCCVRKRTLTGHFACIAGAFPRVRMQRVAQDPADEMPDEGATTGTRHHARVHARASASAADSCAPALDEAQLSAPPPNSRLLSAEERASAGQSHPTMNLCESGPEAIHRASHTGPWRNAGR